MLWKKPSVFHEIMEFLRVMDEYEISFLTMVEMLEDSKFKPLSDNDWKMLLNTSSWKATDMSKVEYILNKQSEIDEFPYTIDRSLLNAFNKKNKKSVSAPITLELPDGNTHLIAGNRRLILARVFGIRPITLHLTHPLLNK